MQKAQDQARLITGSPASPASRGSEDRRDSSSAAEPGRGLSSFFECLSMPAAVVDGALRFTAINPAFEERLGYRPEELIGRHVLEIYDPLTVDAVQTEIRSMVASEVPRMQVERHLLSRSGERFHSLVRISRYQEAGSGFSSMLFDDLEPTGTKEARLVSRSEAFRVTIERSPIPILIQDKDWRFVLANQAFCDYVGYAPDELLGRDPIDFMHSPQSVVEVLRQREALGLADRDTVPRMSSIREAVTRDGRSVSYRLELDRMNARDGSPLWCGMVIDLSHLAQAQADLDRQVGVARRMQTRFQAFAGSLDEAVIVVSPDGDKILHANAATREVFEIAPRALVGASLPLAWMYASEASRHALADAYRRMMRNGHAEAEAVFLDGSGLERLVRARFFRSEDPLPEFFLLGEDVTQRRRRQQARLDEALQQRETLVREIHHRIKNNLQGAAGLLERAGARSPDTREALRDVAQQIHAIAKVHGLQVRSGRLLDPAEVATSIAEQLQRNFGRAIRLDVEATSAPAWLLPESQAVAIALVINELLTNALKHGHAAGEVGMQLRSTDDGLELAIVNEGELRGDRGVGDQGAGKGLQMMHQLLPMRGSSFELVQDGARVVARLRLAPPALQAKTAD